MLRCLLSQDYESIGPMLQANSTYSISATQTVEIVKSGYSIRPYAVVDIDSMLLFTLSEQIA